MLDGLTRDESSILLKALSWHWLGYRHAGYYNLRTDVVYYNLKNAGLTVRCSAEGILHLTINLKRKN